MKQISDLPKGFHAVDLKYPRDAVNLSALSKSFNSYRLITDCLRATVVGNSNIRIRNHFGGRLELKARNSNVMLLFCNQCIVRVFSEIPVRTWRISLAQNDGLPRL